MDLRVRGRGPSAPFLSARDLLETECDLERPVEVRLAADPDVRTAVTHRDGRHILRMARQVAASAFARELALHEFAHMARHEEGHPSHVQPTEEVLSVALDGRRVDRRRLLHCYQIANHMKDIYADDITLAIGPGEKLLAYLESQLAAAVADRPVRAPRPGLEPSAGADPEITAVNAAFALALAERHDLLAGDHGLYDLARAAAADAPRVDVGWFRRQFRDLREDPDSRSYRGELFAASRAYVDGTAAE